ncbi:unnamed protein product [Polarella glacialis]|uniref:COX assembly mitochondrial protein n=1 Tax=Polarella glacialis TaxID=89957 RepID=A0A813K5U3_POLGL|nr:unnamed protein product [Polarella glacialis]CAE8639856.1 unnamed protein product [Polarella glacialis]CAE8694820.1 unnamed protein product [Polarella glacialis]|eukprot:CAMPEP_0115091082 /NCGR_PEP_ID=MMETSP0227-20121206/25868_1 /TAXON_ID=89957 /ORGANISM="Polarella glacialis, Strain CCMP 1383" /LENGTH=88 /DNA_ID=CAMNT_0002482461 /DNA_START=79 /DNA_END=345 /DNA_ORIENTATION=-
MTSVVDTKVALRSFRGCVKEKGAASCSAERKALVAGIAGSVKGECAPYVEDFFACFTHRYALSTCNDATVAKMLKCQEQFSGQLLSSQ